MWRIRLLMPDRTFLSGGLPVHRLTPRSHCIRTGSIIDGDSGVEDNDIDVGLERRAGFRSEVDSMDDAESAEDWGDLDPVPRSRSRESIDSMPAEAAAPFRRRRRIVSASSDDE